MVLVRYRIRACVDALMSFTTHLHSNPKEHDSPNARRSLICVGNMGQSPSVALHYINVLPTYYSAVHVHDRLLIASVIATMTRSSFIRDDYKMPV